MPKGTLPAYLLTLLGRLPAGALGLALILRTRDMTGSYAAGGFVAGAYILALGASAPMLARTVDRRGQRGVLLATGGASIVLLGAFAALPDGTSAAAAIALAAATGLVTPPTHACIRSIWTGLLSPAARHKAFNLDSVAFECLYICSPLLIVGGLGAWSMRAAIAASGLLIGLGAIAFAATRLSRGWQPTATRRDPLGALRSGGIRVLMAAIGLFGVSLGAIEIAIAAFATDHGSEGSVALLLALWGAGSMAGGIAAARAQAPEDPARRLTLQLVALAALEVPLAAAGSIEVMAIALTLAGVCLAPSLALIFNLAVDVSPAGTTTEGMTWMTTALAAGLAAGSALSGALIEASGTTLALALVGVYGLAAAAVVAGSRSALATA